MHSPVVLSEKPKMDHNEKHGMMSLFRIKHFRLVLIIVILLQAAHASYYSYGYIFLQEINARKYLIGLILNIAVIAEIIFFSIADKRFQQFSVGFLLALAALGSTIRWILVFSFPNVIVSCFAQTLHAFSFAMGHYAFMKYLIKSIPPAQVPKAQGMYSALALSLEHYALLTIFGGFFIRYRARICIYRNDHLFHYHQMFLPLYI